MGTNKTHAILVPFGSLTLSHQAVINRPFLPHVVQEWPHRAGVPGTSSAALQAAGDAAQSEGVDVMERMHMGRAASFRSHFENELEKEEHTKQMYFFYFKILRYRIQGYTSC